MGLIKEIIYTAFAIIFLGSTIFGAQTFYKMVQKEAITAVARGPMSLTKLTEQLTCKKYNEKMELEQIATGHCSKYLQRKSKRKSISHRIQTNHEAKPLFSRGQ